MTTKYTILQCGKRSHTTGAILSQNVNQGLRQARATPVMPGVARVSFVIRRIFVRTILRTTKGTYCTLGGCGQTPVSGTPLLGCATPPDQSPAEALLGASGK